MAGQDRDWNLDGRVLNAVDAAQVVEAYRIAYSPTRFRWLMKASANRGRSEAIDGVFRKALDYVPCPACNRAYDATKIPPPRVPLDIRCACCCQ